MFLIILWFARRRTRQAARLRPTTGMLHAIAPKFVRLSGRAASASYWTLAVRYDYAVDGTPCRGDRFALEFHSWFPDEAAVDRSSCLALGIQSPLALPLRAGKTLVGGLVLSTGSAEAAWRDELLEQLSLIGEVAANALERAHAEREMGRLRQQLARIGRVSALGELSASLAHELNQPLMAILNNAYVAQQLLEAAGPDLG